MLTSGEVTGDIVKLVATHRSHFGEKRAEVGDEDLVTGFTGALKKAFYKVNELQLRSDEMTRALAVSPDSVDIHDVTIAAEKARIALQFTKSIVDRVTQAYRELMNMR